VDPGATGPGALQPSAAAPRPTLMAVLRTLLVIALPTCLLVLAAPAPHAAACSCVVAEPSDFVEWADTIFVGTLVDIAPPPERPIMSSADPATYRFEVTDVLEGEPRESTEVQSAQSGASCGLELMEVGTRYVVFASRDQGDGKHVGLSANLCGGTAPVDGALLAEVERLTGPDSPPAPGETSTGPPSDGVARDLLGLAGLAFSAALVPFGLGALDSWWSGVG
jgi:hypothetical protein